MKFYLAGLLLEFVLISSFVSLEKCADIVSLCIDGERAGVKPPV